MTIDDLLDSTSPILYETGDDEFPYAYAGTCFPIKYKNALYIVSAYHCFKNWNIAPSQTMYMTPDDARATFAFDFQDRPSITTARDCKHKDIVILHMAPSKHAQGQIDRVVALDVAVPYNSKVPTSTNLSQMAMCRVPL